MGSEAVNKNKDSIFHGDYTGRDKITNIIMFQDMEREFVVTRNVNIKPVTYFTGRETELKKLCQWIEEGRKSVLVSGMGGIGKTQICRKLFEEYSNRHAEDENIPFRHIGYIEYDGDMGSSLQSCLKYKEQDNPEKNREAAWRELEYLASDGKLLLFVDNVDKTMREDQSLQWLNSIPGAIVLTSRQASFSDEFEPYQIGFLDTAQCKEIYERIRYRGSGKNIKPEEHQDLEYIIDELVGRHTMTVQFIANLARTKPWSVKRLRGELEEKGFCLEFHKNGEIVNIQKAYEVLYDLSELTEEEKNILEAFSVFPYIPLAAETCNEWLLADAGASEEDDILIGLYEKGWLQFDVEQESYALHPVFGQFIYDRYKPGSQNHLGLIESCRKSLEIPESGSALEGQKFIPFAEKMIEKLEIEKDFAQVDFIADIAYFLSYIAKYKKAEGLYRKMLHISERVLGGDHPDTATVYNNLAVVYERQGEYKKAEELYEKGLGIRERVLGEDHLDTAVSYNNLAGVYEEQREYKKAEELHEKSLRIRERILGKEHLDTATSYNNLAVVYRDQGKYKKAEELHEKSLRIRKRVLGEEHPDTATSYSNLAGVYGYQGEYRKAEELYQKSLRISKRVLGEEHPDTAINYNNLAGVYRSQGEYKIALSHCFKAYKVLMRKLGINHPNTQIVYKNMKIVYFEWNPKGNFKQWFEESMKK